MRDSKNVIARLHKLELATAVLRSDHVALVIKIKDDGSIYYGAKNMSFKNRVAFDRYVEKNIQAKSIVIITRSFSPRMAKKGARE